MCSYHTAVEARARTIPYLQHTGRSPPFAHSTASDSCAKNPSFTTLASPIRHPPIPATVKLHDWFNLCIIALLNVLNAVYMATGQG